MSALADDLACALDPVRLARRMGVEPDPWQARVLRSASRQVILNCSRQVGKSTVTGILAGHTALYEPGAPILLLSPTERQSIELLRKVKDTLRQLGTAATEVEKDNALSLEFANGSRILALPGKEGTIRGFSGVRLLVIDEESIKKSGRPHPRGRYSASAAGRYAVDAFASAFAASGGCSARVYL